MEKGRKHLDQWDLSGEATNEMARLRTWLEDAEFQDVISSSSPNTSEEHPDEPLPTLKKCKKPNHSDQIPIIKQELDSKVPEVAFTESET